MILSIKVFRDIYNIELSDSHFSNDTNFDLLDNSHHLIRFNIENLPGYYCLSKRFRKESITKEQRILPKVYGEHTF